MTESRPTALPNAFALDTIVAGGDFHCGIALLAGDAYCWGAFPTPIDRGSLGDGRTVSSRTPVRVVIPARVRAITAGYTHACAVDENGVGYCWGFSTTPTLGTDVPPRWSALPRPVAGSHRWSMISGGTTHSCGVTVDGVGYCWGGWYGALGLGARDTSCAAGDSCYETAIPMPVEGNLRWRSIRAGNGATCGLTLDDRAYCWGEVRWSANPDPPYGIVGDGSFRGSKAPVAVSGSLRFRSIELGTRHACGVTLDGTPYCWGNNDLAELGVGTSRGRYATPQLVAGDLKFAAFGLADHSCAISVNRNLYCWGANDVQDILGTGDPRHVARNKPTRVLPPLP